MADRAFLLRQLGHALYCVREGCYPDILSFDLIQSHFKYYIRGYMYCVIATIIMYSLYYFNHTMLVASNNHIYACQVGCGNMTLRSVISNSFL